jgi:hypothetical protein
MKPNEKTYVSLLCNHDGCHRSHTLGYTGVAHTDLVSEGKMVRADAEYHGWDTVNDLCPEHKK